MTGLFGPYSATAERCHHELNRVLADFRKRTHLYRPSSVEARDSMLDASLKLVALSEMFASERVIEMVERLLPTDPLSQRLWDERADNATRDWPGRRRAWKLCGLDWYPDREWGELDGFISARNVIAHGMGSLTHSQLRRGAIKPDFMSKIGAARLTLDGDRLLIAADDVERCGARVSHFIKWLDSTSRR